MTLQFSIVDQVAFIRLNRPQALNALNRELLEELSRALTKVETEGRVRAVVLSGEGGKAFVAGADLKEIQKLNAKSAIAFCEFGQGVFRRLERLGVPTLARVEGFALGGGLELALACDFIYASETSQFGLPEVGLGLIPGFGGTQRLMRLVGIARAREMILTGKTLSAQQALLWGLVNFVGTPAELEGEVQKTLAAFKAKGPRAIAAAKDTVNRGFDLDLDSALELERDAFANLFLSEEPKEGVQAFLEKRSPVF